MNMIVLTTPEAAQYLRLSVDHLRRLVQAGKMKSIKGGYHTQRFNKDTLDRWLIKHEK